MIDVDRFALYQAIRTLVAGLAAIYIASYFHSMQSYWIILTAAVLVQIRIGYLIHEHIVCQLIAGLFAAILVFAASYIGNSIFMLAMFLALTSFISVYLGFRYRNLFLAAYLVNLLTMISGGSVVDPVETLMRAKYVLGGVGVSLVTTSLFWPNILKFKIKAIMKVCLKTSLKLLRLIFDIYIKRDYSANHFFYEKKIYYLSRLHAYWMRALRNLNQRAGKIYSDKVARIDRIFEIVTSLGALRYYVKDHTTFGMLDRELSAILASLETEFNVAANRRKILIENPVEANIESLNEVYQGMLQVAAQEPLVYLFFIQGLKALNEEISKYIG